MRIISQDGVYDTPYEITQLWIQERNGVADLYHIRGSMPADEAITLAIYSSEEKALKAMKMLREEYFETEHEKTYRDGVYYFLPVFQFPKDDEVEV